MILSFSGTGNSAYIAKQIANSTGDNIVDVNQKLKSNDTAPLHSEKPWVIVAPTYAWCIPRVMQQWLERTPLSGSKKAYILLTCGDSTGPAAIHAKKLMRKLGLDFCGFATVLMPENYLAMFPVPPQDKAFEMIKKATANLEPIIEAIKNEKSLPKEEISLKSRLLTPLMIRWFYAFIVKSKPFFTYDSCDGCSACEKICPMNTITIQNKRPVWNNNCTHCMACITHCHAEAIEYGTKSVGKDRYTLAKTLKNAQKQEGNQL